MTNEEEAWVLGAVGAHRRGKWNAVVWMAAVLGGSLCGLFAMRAEISRADATHGLLMFAAACSMWLGAVAIVYVGFIEPSLARACLREEMAWLNSVPFPMEGYFGRLAQPPRWARTRINVDMQDGCPERSELENRFAAAEGSLLASDPEAKRFVAQGPNLCGPQDRYRGRSNAPALEWQRRLVADVLMPLHLTRRIARVQLVFDP